MAGAILKAKQLLYLVKNPFQELSFIDPQTEGMDHISETGRCTPKSAFFLFGYAFTLHPITLPCPRNGHMTKFSLMGCKLESYLTHKSLHSIIFCAPLPDTSEKQIKLCLQEFSA